MKSYELTYIISPDLISDQVNTEVKEIESFVQSKEGVVLKSEKTGAQTLAYPIKNRGSGYFATLTFQILEDRIKELRENLEKNKNILRHFIMVNKPIRAQKKRRTRKPLVATQSQTATEYSFLKNPEKKKESEKIDLDKIDKKLDELLNE